MNTTKTDLNGIERDAFGNINPAHIHKAVAMEMQNLTEHHRNYVQELTRPFEDSTNNQEFFTALTNLQEYICNKQKLLDILDEKDAFYNLLRKQLKISKDFYTEHYQLFILL